MTGGFVLAVTLAFFSSESCYLASLLYPSSHNRVERIVLGSIRKDCLHKQSDFPRHTLSIFACLIPSSCLGGLCSDLPISEDRWWDLKQCVGYTVAPQVRDGPHSTGVNTPPHSDCTSRAPSL